MNKVTVKFHGNLAQFGEKFELYANTANEAIRSLAIQIDGLKQYLRKGYYRVEVDDRIVTQSEYVAILDVSDGSVIHVSPRVAGSGKWGTFIAGAVLTVVGGVLSYFGFGVIGGPMMKAGIGFMIGGVAQALTRPKEFNQDHRGVEDSKSSAFTNLTNVVGQGKRIPRAYGDIRVGSVLASQSLSSYRPDISGGTDTIQTSNYSKKRIEPMPAEDPKGNPYRLDPMSDSMREAAVTITTEWS